VEMERLEEVGTSAAAPKSVETHVVQQDHIIVEECI